ncbi:MAG: hypothetical protein J6B50_00985 [Lachnospiraceae bacterium]|nr:hypothetical protein [Lachnospiraceae bacterium]
MHVNKLLDIAKRDVSRAPKGRLRIAHNHGTEQYYHVSEESNMLGRYISKKNYDFIHSLAQKDYARQMIEYLEKKKKELERMREIIRGFDDNMVYLKLNDNRKNLISPYYISDREYIEDWSAELFETKPFQEEQPEIFTERGERVRSKSEKMIADKLLMLGVPYKYEHPLYLSEVGIVYPDFTLLNIKKREEVLLEHFGMMDNTNYCENAIRKINIYQKNGFIPGSNIIFTFEIGLPQSHWL